VIQSATLRWMKALNHTFGSTARVEAARLNAFEALRHYGLFAYDWGQAYNLGAGSDEFHLALSEQRIARGYARKAAIVLGLSRYP